jgi:hypothetical protein
VCFRARRVSKNYVGLQTPATVPTGERVVLYYLPPPYTAPTAASPPCGYPGSVPEAKWFELGRVSGSFRMSETHPQVRVRCERA